MSIWILLIMKRMQHMLLKKLLKEGKPKILDNLLKFYGFKKVGELALKANWLSDISINFCCVLFKYKPTDFKCYEKKQLNRAHWDF